MFRAPFEGLKSLATKVSVPTGLKKESERNLRCPVGTMIL
jgi:hypothetical protein